MMEELESIEKNGVWELQPCQMEEKPLDASEY
jgi:hypothetical protein